MSPARHMNKHLETTTTSAFYFRVDLLTITFNNLHICTEENLYTFLSSPMHATCPAQHILLDLIYRLIFGEEYKICSSSLCNLHLSPVTSSLLGPNILLRTLFSNTLSLCSSLNVRDQVSHPYKTTGTIIVLRILTFMFLDSRQED
jgi:hypothetical protein